MSNLAYRQPKVPLTHPPPRQWLVSEIVAHESYVTSVAFFGEEYDRIISGSYDEVAKLWNLKTGRCLRKFTGHTDGLTVVMPGPEGRVLTASEDRTVRMWDPDTGECSKIVRSHSGAVTGLCMAGPSRILTGSTDKKLRIFDASGNSVGESELISEIMAVASAPPSSSNSKAKRRKALLSSSPSPNENLSSVAAALVAAESKNEAGGGEEQSAKPSRVRVFACGGVHIPTPAKPMLRSVEVNLAATTAAVAADGSGELNMCTAGLDEPDGEEGVVTSVAISSVGCNGRGVLVTGSYDKGVRVLRNVLPRAGSSGDGEDSVPEMAAEEGDRGGASFGARTSSSPLSMELLGRHAEGVRSVAISTNGRWAVSGSRDGRIKVWEILRESRPACGGPPPALADFEAHCGVVFSMCMSPDARVLISGGSDRFVRIWDLSLVVYARRLAVNRARALWVAGRIRRARAKRASTSSSSVGNAGAAGGAVKAFGTSREQRQQVLEGLFALPEIIYAKVLMYL